MDRKDLKIEALLQRITTLTAQYENQVADLRVELTLTTRELEEIKDSIAVLEETPENPTESTE
jgi:hypothetical protein